MIVSQVFHKKEHQSLIVEEVLQPLQREFVEVVVDVDDFNLGQGVVFEQLQHLLGVDQTPKTENNVRYGDLEFVDLGLHCEFDVTLKELKVVVLVIFFAAQDVYLVEVLLVVLAQVAHQVLVDDLVTDCVGLQLTQFELDSVQVQHPLGCLLGVQLDAK